MSGKILAILLGLLAAFLFALAAYYQQRAARVTERHGSTGISRMAALMSHLVRSRTWLLGWGINVCGFGAQAVALHVGSIASVQPLLATQLLFALPMSSLELSRWPRLRDWLSALAICGGLVLLLVVVGAKALQGAPDRGRILLAVACALAAIALAFAMATRVPHAVANVLLAGSAGLCFSMTAVFIKLTGDDLVHHGIAYTARDWVGYALAGSTLLGLVLEQGAFANGPLPWAIATKDSVNPIASYAIGVLAFPTALPGDAPRLFGLAMAGVLLIAGAVGLAHSPSAGLWLQRDSASVTPAVHPGGPAGSG
ncbi:DMT family transporter [Leekyejoonella antrihumi]|uniref:DMT family transporter n=1 Tax=Leekyejoonella antrihumi TaxID=1660198 RepID=A0A563E818_9MICO|nr:DMT family transporter [Leekyejoonella antrihumi]TWP38670.1 hypothetical protein FGL98_02495 [Leekyejoonella antrihumi]